MSVATITPAKPAKPAAKVDAKPAKPVTLEGSALAAAAAALKARYVLADKGETEARAHFEAADIAWQNARVVKVRVAYAAAMLTPNKGAANLLAATRFLLTDPNDTPAKRTAAAKSRKNTLRNYVAAGEELEAKGMANRTTEPDDEERKIVAAVFRELNKRDKDDAKGNKGEGEGEGEGTPAKGEGQDPVTQADVVDAVATLKSLTERFCRDHGFAAVVADNLSTVLAEVASLMESHKVDGGK